MQRFQLIIEQITLEKPLAMFFSVGMFPNSKILGTVNGQLSQQKKRYLHHIFSGRLQNLCLVLELITCFFSGAALRLDQQYLGIINFDWNVKNKKNRYPHRAFIRFQSSRGKSISDRKKSIFENSDFILEPHHARLFRLRAPFT